ncbi:hypothetical protein DWB85_01690 [Seongchinamella sediminis]|uniref:Translocation and assembly module TamB C-terminal domain-containing protein n=1 Tax=Seongchinamella sediminis TaxID=2283635 RepID=A0A3L7E498_9GAMM|nr:translocation/assembly module TamB domain-containing protein [Seongchinamella sediminis]RLQ23291.1 hypothetical protein DWB85_01690 [Seongchinamella sediminis]
MLPKALKLALATLALLLLLVLAGALAVFGLLATEPGTALLARQAGHYLGETVSWQRVDGTLTGPLRISGLHFRQPGTELRAAQLQLDWRPGALLRGRLDIASLRAEGVDLVLSASASEEPGAAFDPSTIAAPVDIFLRELKVNRLSVTRDGTSQAIDSLQLAASLIGPALVVERFQLRAPQGQLDLRASTRLHTRMPLDLHSTWTFTAGESAPLSGEAGLEGTISWADRIGFALNYSLLADGLQALQPELPASAQVAGGIAGRYAGDRLELDSLTLDQRESGLALAISATVDKLASAAPGIDATLQWTGLRWPLQGDSAALASPAGRLQLAGALDDYRLQLALDLAGAAIPAGSWEASASGDLSQLQLASLQGQLLAGEVLLSGQLGWADAIRWQLQLAAADINPAGMAPELPGRLAALLSTQGVMSEGSPLQAEFAIEHVRGELAGYPLALSGTGSVLGEALQLHTLQLDSGRNGLTARGRLSAESLDLDWQLRALAPGELLAGAGGQLSGEGTLSGSAEAPLVSGRFSGSQLQLDTLAAETLDLDIKAGLQPGDRLRLRLAVGPVRDAGSALLQSLSLEADGSNREHRLALALATPSGQLRATLQGGLGEAMDSWQGALQSLRADSADYGSWQLAERSELALSATAARLATSCLARIDGPGRACVGGNWSPAAGSDLAVSLSALPLGLIQPAVTADINAKLQGRLATDGGLRAEGKLTLSPGLITLAESKRALAHGGGEMELRIDGEGLAATLAFAAPENGRLDADLRLPALSAIPLAEEQPLAGHIRASLPDLSGAAAWVPELAASGGAIAADLQLAGSLADPRLQGYVKLDNGRADIPLAGLQLRDIALELASAATAPDTLALNGSLRSGKGLVTLGGRVDLSQGSLQLALEGDNVLAYNTGDARLWLSPDMQVSWLQDTLTLRGEVFVPRAEITPQLELSPAMVMADGEQADTSGQAIAPSQDVVIVSGQLAGMEDSAATAPFRIDNQLRLRLGDAVNVNALGFIGRLSGDVLFTNTPEQTELVPIANGKLSVEDGTFRSFGQDLDIRTGELLFNNRPATEPEINLRAVRWIDNDPQVTSAGILLTGPITTPTMELFSRPQLETSEVQSYLITGRSTRDRSSVLSIGTYVSPRIYVGYGYNTLEKTSEFNSLFTITPRYGVGLNAGEADSNLNMTFSYEH